MAECNVPIQGRRRIFWTTQPDACGEQSYCHSNCGSSGLKSYVPGGQAGRTFKNDNYVRSLALNIILTNGKKADRACGYRPGARGGHWSESYGDNLNVGTNLRDIPTTYTIAEAIKLIQANLTTSLHKLVLYGVALSVDVKVKYLGSNVFDAAIDIISQDGLTSRVGITGNRLENSWVWGSN
jgi:phage gp46-like protein